MGLDVPPVMGVCLADAAGDDARKATLLLNVSVIDHADYLSYFAVIGSPARHGRPRIRFLFIGSRLCSALLSGLACAESDFILGLC
jgi:hypothetical protein